MRHLNPKSAWLTVNRRCNFRCRWCYAEGSGYDRKSDMSLEMARALTSMINQMGIKHLLIIGGEPTLWRQLITLNRFCREAQMETVLVTNGMRFGQDEFWERYLECPNDRIGLSLKAGNREQLRESAGVTNFKILRLGVSRATQELRAGVSITYNKLYSENLLEIVQFAMDCGSPSVKIDFCSTVFDGRQPFGEYMVDPSLLAQNMIRDYSELDRITGGRLVFEMMVPFCLFPEDFLLELKHKNQLLSVCHVHRREGLIFDPAGNLLICNALFDFPIGRFREDFMDGQSLKEWLDTPRVLSYYDRMGCYPSSDCRKCSWYSACGGGCPLRWAMYKPEKIIQPFLRQDDMEV